MVKLCELEKNLKIIKRRVIYEKIYKCVYMFFFTNGIY